MPKNPKISILIPVYNVEKYITACLNSITAQTYPHFEIYAMDDGSTDNTYPLLKEYEKKEPRLHSFTQKNSGVTKTLNALLEMVPNDTDYLFYADADDLIHPQALETLLFYIKKYNADISECQSERIDEKTMAAPAQTVTPTEIPTRLIEDMNIFLTKKTLVGNWLPRWNKLYHWDAVKSIRFDETLAHEDDYFYASLVCAAVKNKVLVQAPLYYYRRNPTSMNGSLNFQKYQTSAVNRINLSYETFIAAKAVPEKYLRDFKKDLATDAYRMIIRKNLRKNKDKTLKKQLFLAAADAFDAFKQNNTIDFKLLTLPQQLMVWLCHKRCYTLARALSFI